ncbi:glycosyltransferase family 4 protein [Lacihabitans soyangensis]|uniref:Glycosyltransferase family 1 protein n=1 Tax=Lacihabitans soyangensis TaxID=869394 RepID=A0AAE3H457_9BACT|nr:glycosyltransferase family 1 protein [Lacihabitans soyangensis]MCP9764809.1 glycosyltransferase family 1 protein [Lacihabitans soyangensis]
MRIGYDAKRAFCNNTGLGNYSRFIIENILNFKDENIDIVAYTPKTKEGYFETFPKEKILLPQKKLLSSIWRLHFIKKDIKAKALDIFHGLSSEIPIFVNWKNTKTVVTVHDLIFLKYPQYYKYFDALIYKLKYKYACHKADKIIAISQQTKNDIIEHFGIPENKIEVIYQSIQDIYRKEISESERNIITNKYKLQKPFILSVGTLEPRKNQLNIVKAFHQLNDKNLELILVGRGKKYKDEIIAYIENNKIENIKVLSEVKTEDLPAIYQSCLTFIYISSYEGFGIPIVEALASQKSIIAAKGSCLEEAAGEGAIYIEPDNINQITEAVKAMSNNEDLRRKLARKGQEHLKNFDSDLLISKVMKVYKSLL